MYVVKELIDCFIKRPGILFLIDGIGAMLTAVVLFIVLSNFQEYFGMPKMPLICLSAVAACFCFYSMACFVCLKENRTPFISIIGVANLLYCLLTMGLLINYCSQVTSIGIAYFLTEIIIICGLAFIELSVANKIKKTESEITSGN